MSKPQRREQNAVKELYRAQLATEAGRAFFWHLTQMAGVHRSVWEQSARIHYNAGRQDFGLELLRDARAWDYLLYDLMVREAAQRDLRANELAAGANTQSATEESNNDD